MNTHYSIIKRKFIYNARAEKSQCNRVKKSTVHKDVTERLEKINPILACKAKEILNVNKSERHIRGGLATREKYLTISNKSN